LDQSKEGDTTEGHFAKIDQSTISEIQGAQAEADDGSYLEPSRMVDPEVIDRLQAQVEEQFKEQEERLAKDFNQQIEKYEAQSKEQFEYINSLHSELDTALKNNKQDLTPLITEIQAVQMKMREKEDDMTVQNNFEDLAKFISPINMPSRSPRSATLIRSDGQWS